MVINLSDILLYVKARLDELSNNDDASLVILDPVAEDIDKIITNVAMAAARKIHLDAPNILLRDGQDFSNAEIYITLLESAEVVHNGTAVTVEPNSVYYYSPGGSQTVYVTTESDWAVTMRDYNRGVPATPAEYINGVFMYKVALPGDFLRLVTLKMSDWDRPIQTFVGEDSAEYHKQFNKYLRGTTKKPIGILVHDDWPDASRYAAHLYTCGSNHASIERAWYIPEPSIDLNTGDMVICSTLEYPCLNQITAETLRSLGKYQEAKVYDGLAVQPFYIDPDYARLNPLQSERVQTIKQ